MFATGNIATGKRIRVNKDVVVNKPRIVEANDLDNSGDDEFVKAGDIDNVKNNAAQNNYAHEGTGAGGEKSPQGGANSDAAEVRPKERLEFSETLMSG